jgi:Zn-dependent protease with chaperone function
MSTDHPTLLEPSITPDPEGCTVLFYDGKTSKAQHGRIEPTDDPTQVAVVLPDQTLMVAIADLRIQGAIGSAAPMIELPHNMRLELQQLDVPQWLQHPHASWWNNLWRWERSRSWIIASLLITVLVVAGVVRYGIPALSNQIAFALPVSTLDDVGDQTLTQLDDQLLLPSKLSAAHQAQIRAAYNRYIGPEGARRQLLFRDGGMVGANAFALPNGVMVMTDQLVKLSKNDLELVSVLAHETGHEVRRHSMRQMIGGASLGVLIVAMTGDTSNLLAALPVGLANMKYSRDFEREADDYAYNLMVKQHIPLHYFADILQRLEQQDEEKEASSESSDQPSQSSNPSKPSADSDWRDFLASHPATNERIERFKQPAS